MIPADNKGGDGGRADNALQRLLAAAEYFLRPHTFGAFGMTFDFLLEAFFFHLPLPINTALNDTTKQRIVPETIFRGEDDNIDNDLFLLY